MKRATLCGTGLLLMCAVLMGQENPVKSKPASIEGIVTKLGTGEPLQNVRVSASGSQDSKSATTNAQGRFVIADLAPGAYDVDASRPLFIRSRKIAHLTLSPDQHLRDVNIQLTPAGVITGRIYDQNRQPLPSVSVEALRYQYREGVKVFVSAGQGMSDDRGEYRIFNLQPGAYYVRATLPNPSQNLSAPVYYPGVVDPQDGSRITVVPEAESSAIDIPFGGNKTFSIRIKVSAAVQSGGPQPTTFYAVRRDRGPEPVTFQTESLGNGVFRISPFTPGVYEVFAQVHGLTGDVAQSGRVSVNIGDQDVDAGTLIARPNGSVMGRIVASEPLSAPLDRAGIGISLRPMAGSPSTLTTSSRNPGGALKEDGAFVIPNVANGRFRIEVNGLPDNVYLISARIGGVEVIDRGIDIDGPQQSPVELQLGGAGNIGSIEGVVRGRNDQPVGDSVVAIIPAPNRRENPAAFKTAITDQMGVFSIRGLLPGAYTVLAWEDIETGAYQNPEILTDYENRGVKTVVESGGRNVLEVRVIPRPER